MKRVKAKLVKAPKCKTPEHCQAISEGMKAAYRKGRRYVNIGKKQGTN